MDSFCLQIINSDRVDSLAGKTKRDMLEDEAWLREVMERWQIGAPLPVPAAAMDGMKKLRERMHAFLSGDRRNIGAFNRILEGVPVRFRLDIREESYRLDYTCDAAGWDLALWRIAKSFADMLCSLDISRIKICENSDCGWAFYDGSKNKSRRWCSDKTCGNVMKVRRFRERQKTE